MLSHGILFYDEDQFDLWFKRFDYIATFIRENKNFKKSIWVHNRTDFLELLNIWNRDSFWKYTEK